MSAFTQHNVAVIDKRINGKRNRPLLTDAIYDGLASIANLIMEQIDEVYYPLDTGNAREATAVAIYIDGVVTVFRSERDLVRNELQVWSGGYYRGREQLALALNFGASKFSKGVWIVLYAAQPYAKWLNEVHTAHIGYFDDYADELSDLVNQIVVAHANQILSGNFKPKAHKSRFATF